MAGELSETVIPGHKSEIRSRWVLTRVRTYLICTCGELSVEIPQGSSVDWPIAKYAAHAFEMAIRGKMVVEELPELPPPDFKD